MSFFLHCKRIASVAVLSVTAGGVLLGAQAEQQTEPPTQQVQEAELNENEFAESHELIEIRGWTLMLNHKLRAEKPELTATLLELMDVQLERVENAIPVEPLRHLKTVRIWVNPEYEGVRPTAEYHPSRAYLRKNDRLPAMARAIEVTTVDRFKFECVRMPYLMLHELSHAYHDQVLGFRNTEIREAFEAAEESGDYEEVDRFNGRKIVKDKAYAMSNHKEYFAESTEAYFGRNDFYPFDRDELRQHDPSMLELLEKLWQVGDAEEGAGEATEQKAVPQAENPDSEK